MIHRLADCLHVNVPEITIGTNTVIGAGCVLPKDVPAYSVVYGNPAKIKCKLDINQIDNDMINNNRILPTGVGGGVVLSFYLLPINMGGAAHE